MIHPFANETILDEMSNASDPQTDRELLLQLNHQVGRLSEAIESFAEKLERFKEKEIADMEKRLKDLEEWKSQWSGVYRFLAIALTILTILSIIIKYQ